MRLEASYQRLFKAETSSLTRALELFFLSLGVPALGFYFQPEDPFFLTNQFPWLLFPPLMLGVRYGLLYGLLSVAILLILLFGSMRFGFAEIETFPVELILGILIVTIIAGEIATQAQMRIKRNQARVEYLNMRIDEFTRAYHILKVSHDQMEENLAGSRMSLREALQIVREEMDNHTAGAITDEIGQEILIVFSHFSWMQIAGLYLLDNKGQLQDKPLATVGDMPDLYKKDVLLAEALEEGDMVSIRPEMYAQGVQKELNTNLLAVLPITDVTGQIWAVIAVHEMHLMAFQDENLNLMELLGGYVGDLLSHADTTLLDEGGKNIFIRELRSAVRISTDHHIISILAYFRFRDDDMAETYAQAIASRIRGLDHAWELHNKEGKPVVFLLMPLMGSADFERYESSLNGYFQERFGVDLEEAGIQLERKEILREHRLRFYVKFLSENCNVEPERLSI